MRALFLVVVLLCGGAAQSAEVNKWKLDLYYRVDCRYCQKVIHYLNQKGIAIVLKEINREEETKAELIDLTGRKTVPCLTINNTPLFESDDIIQWFEENISHFH